MALTSEPDSGLLEVETSGCKSLFRLCRLVSFGGNSRCLTLRSVTRAKSRLVRDSATAIRAPAAGSMSPLMGCSPRAVAPPTVSKGERATTATSARGVCKGPTHCCCATSPVTERSTCIGEKEHRERRQPNQQQPRPANFLPEAPIQRADPERFPRYLVGQVTFTSHGWQPQHTLQGIHHTKVTGKVQRLEGSIDLIQDEFLLAGEQNAVSCTILSQDRAFLALEH